MSFLLLDDDLAERGDRLDPAARPQGDRCRALLHASAGNLGVLVLKRLRHVGDGEVVGAQAVGVHQHVDLTRTSADDHDLPDAADALELPAERLVRVFRDVAKRLVGGNRQCEDRRAVRIEFLDRRLVDRPREEWKHAIHAVAHFLSRDVGILLQQERDDDLRDAFRRVRSELVDAADRVDRLFDLVGDFRFDLFGRGARQSGRHDDGREVNFGKAIETQPHEGEGADDCEGEDDHRRKDRTAYGD